MTPTVSVIITNYNYGHYIADAMRSVLQQTYKDYELIVVDDGSTDNSLKIIHSFISTHPTAAIRVISQENGGTPSHARNVGIHQSSGKYILPLDADDLIHPQMLELGVRALEHNPDIGFVYTDHHNLKPDGTTEQWNHSEYDLNELKKDNIACYCSLFRKSAWHKVGGYQRIGYEDWELWLSFAEIGITGKRIPEPLFIYRENEKGRFSKDLKEDQAIRLSIRQRHPKLYNKEGKGKRSLVSVIIPAYNYGHYVTEAILSVLEQSYTEFECIVINDGSTDSTVEQVEKMIEQYPDYDISLVNKVNSGLSDTRNYGGWHAKGDYILFLDADDKIHTDFLTETVSILDNNEEVGFAYTDVQHIGVRNDIWSGGAYEKATLLFRNQLTCTSLVRSRAFREVGGFKERMDSGYEDWEFWISCVDAGWLGYHIAKPYFFYRKHKQESMLQQIDRQTHMNLLQKIVDIHPQLYIESASVEVER